MIKALLNHQLARFLAVGGLTAILYLSASYLLLNVLGVEYRLGISAAYVVSVSFHFFCNRKYTFAVGAGELFWPIVRYCCVLVVNYGLVLAVAMACVRFLRLSSFVSSAVSICFTTALTFLLLSRWVFAGGAPEKQRHTEKGQQI